MHALWARGQGSALLHDDGRRAEVQAGALTLALAALLVGLALSAAPVQAASTTRGLPRLLTQFGGSTFAVRPATVVPFVDGGMVIGKLGKRGGSIHWREWTTSNASGSATLWIDNGIPNMAQGTFYSYSATIHVYRVRNGRFTRMTVRYHQSGKQRTKTWALGELSPTSYTW